MSADKPWSERWIEIEPLGSGGQGDTVLVKAVLGEPAKAVLKVLRSHKAQDAKARGRMAQEVTNLRVLHNAGGKVPRVLDGNTEKFEDLKMPLYFVMEHIAGDTLANAIQQSSGLSAEASVGIALELCSTLRVAVKEGIVHRDIKPENIIVRAITPPDVVMVDFGLSFNEDEDHKYTSADESLDNKFLSLPERRGPDENKRDPRSDVTGVCAILFYCLTKCSPRNLRDSQGRPPHRWPNYQLSGRVQSAPQLALLNSLLDRGLSYELESRFQTIDELISRLNEVVNPMTKPQIEDLDVVAAREAASLRKNDRKTQLSNYYARAQLLGQSVSQCINDLTVRLSRHNAFSVGWARSFERANGKSERGDDIAKMGFMLNVQNHALRYEFHYSICAQGAECTLYREVQELNPGKPTKLIEAATVVFRYQGESEIDRAAVVADIRETVTRLIPLLSQQIQTGY